MTENRPYRLIVSGGGTGGHIFPALAVANELKKQNPLSEILFIGAKGKMEMTRVPAAGYEIEGLWISGLQRKLTFENLLFPIKLILSVLKASRIIKKFKPDAIVGTGGYASGPTVIAASRKNIPVLLQEQNSYPGLTNRKLSRYAKKVCVAYDNMDRYFDPAKVVFTGNPVREDIDGSKTKRSEALTYFGLADNKKTVLIIGGSLGARTINESIVSGVNRLVDAGFQVLWQTGKLYYEEMLDRSSVGIEQGVAINQFIDRMDYAYSCADIVISRAGALSISELCIAGLPVIFVPSPNVAADHQRKNAESLVKQDAALLVEDAVAKEKLIDVLIETANNEELLIKLAKEIKKLAKPDATKDIVKHLKMILN
ncbi:MAG: undecaprenyldiphospho-muramoylpentapeptide beta-N-acetylglucosaminyltransferase [Cyclobacteriaceae bacterium]|nr:undecaprenyldiphospho-muramoylpentapeptide beta-N-acetylglucosaminyltransferase [Cyclobacteriaceae bacterium]